MSGNTLRGRIITMYGTIDEFAKAMKWSHRKASYIINGKQEPTGKEIESMAAALRVEIPDELRSLFF